jgi:hypothetical protein
LYKINILHIAILCVVPTELTWSRYLPNPELKFGAILSVVPTELHGKEP